MIEEEYERWLAESLNEALALLRRGVANPPRDETGALARIHGSSERSFDAKPKGGLGGKVESAPRSEALPLQMIGLFTLLALHADIDVDDFQAASDAERELRASQAINHLSVAIRHARLGHNEAARKRVEAALRRLNENKHPS